MTVGPVEIGLGLAIVLLLFGYRWLPGVARGVARAPAEYLRGRKDG